MQSAKEPAAIRFGPFRLHLKAGELHRNGRKIRLQEQPFKVLTALLERPGEVVTREELQNRLWPDGTNVDFDKSINSAIKRLRDVLNDDADKPKYVETVARRGYRMLPAPHLEDGPPKAPAIATLQETGTAISIPEISVDKPPSSQTEGRFRHRRFLRVLTGLAAVIAVIGLLIAIRMLVWPLGPRLSAVAVLPFEDLSGDRREEFFADGMTEELIGNLGKISGLRVISRTSAMAYRNTKKTVKEIARELHVDGVIEGTVLHSGDRVRITAHLIQATPEAQLWMESYERDLRDVMILQDEVAREIANQIRMKLSPAEERRLTNARPVSPQAQVAYLKARYLLSQRTDAGMRRSLEFFKEAIDADSRFALAYAGLADSYVLLTSYGLLPPNEAYPEAERLATKALEIDDTIAEPHTALGFARCFYDRDWLAADREFRTAIALNPNYPTAHVWYGELLATLGQAKRAISEFSRARELDPLSLFVNASYGRMLRDGRHFDEAIEQCRKTIDLEPNFAHGHWCLGLAYLGKGRRDDAIFELQKAKALGEGPVALWALAYGYGVAGKRLEARNVLSELRGQSQRSYVSPYFLAGVYAGLGEKDRAFEYLQMAYDQRDAMSLELDPFLDSLRSDRRFHELLRRMNLP